MTGESEYKVSEKNVLFVNVKKIENIIWGDQHLPFKKSSILLSTVLPSVYKEISL